MGRARPFHDGGGLCSPGRWDRDRRVLPEGVVQGAGAAFLGAADQEVDRPVHPSAEKAGLSLCRLQRVP